MSEGVVASALVSPTTSSSVAIAETFEASTANDGLLSIQVGLLELGTLQDTSNASAELVAGVAENSSVFQFNGILGQYAVFNNETTEISDTALGNTSSNVGVQEATNLDAEETRRLLWENIDDSQSPGWQPIDTN